MSDKTTITLSPPHAALAAICLVAALDGDADALARHVQACRQLSGEDIAQIRPLVHDMADAPDGVEAVLALIGDNMPTSYAETVYVLCADYVALYGRTLPAQLRLLERLGEVLRLDRLTRAALDRAALARAQDLTGETQA